MNFWRFLTLSLLMFCVSVSGLAQEKITEQQKQYKFEETQRDLAYLTSLTQKDYANNGGPDPEAHYRCMLRDLAESDRKLSDLGITEKELKDLMAKNSRLKAKAYWAELVGLRRAFVYRVGHRNPGNTFNLILFYLEDAREFSGDRPLDEQALLFELGVSKEMLCRTMARVHSYEVEFYFKELNTPRVQADDSWKEAVEDLIRYAAADRRKWRAGSIDINPY